MCLPASLTDCVSKSVHVHECVGACKGEYACEREREREKTKEFAQMLKLEQFEIWRCGAGMQTQRPKNN